MASLRRLWCDIVALLATRRLRVRNVFGILKFDVVFRKVFGFRFVARRAGFGSLEREGTSCRALLSVTDAVSYAVEL